MEERAQCDLYLMRNRQVIIEYFFAPKLSGIYCTVYLKHKWVAGNAGLHSSHCGLGYNAIPQYKALR